MSAISSVSLTSSLFDLQQLSNNPATNSSSSSSATNAASSTQASFSLLLATISVNQTQSTSGVSNSSGSASATGSLGSIGGATDIATLSGPAKFVSELQQLQSQNPAAFQKFVSQAASELQTAATQAGSTPQGQFLSDLANKFQSLANGADISKVFSGGHHHGKHSSGSYNVQGQVPPPPNLLQSLGNNSNSIPAPAAPGSNVGQVLSNLQSQLSQLLSTTAVGSA